MREPKNRIPRMSWRQRALYDDAFGRLFDRWFGVGVGAGLLLWGLFPALAAPGAPIMQTLVLVVLGASILLAAWRAPILVSPASLLFLSIVGLVRRLFPPYGRRRPEADSPNEGHDR